MSVWIWILVVVVAVVAATVVTTLIVRRNDARKVGFMMDALEDGESSNGATQPTRSPRRTSCFA